MYLPGQSPQMPRCPAHGILEMMRESSQLCCIAQLQSAAHREYAAVTRTCAYLVDLGHKVWSLLCRVPDLTQCESNDCIRHSTASERHLRGARAALSCSSIGAILMLHLNGKIGGKCVLRADCAGRTYCNQVVCEAVVHEGVLGHLHSHAGHVTERLS